MDGGRGEKAHITKISHTYKIMELVRILLYIRKIQKINQSRDIPIEFYFYLHFAIGNQQALLYQATHL